MRSFKGTWRPAVNRVPRWRIASAVLVLAGLVFLLAVFTPIYFSNLKLQSFVSDVTQTCGESRETGRHATYYGSG